MTIAKSLLLTTTALLLAVGVHPEAAGWVSANRFGGHSQGGVGWASHTNRWGGTTTGAYGMGAVHTTPAGFSAYRSPGYGYAGYAPYHVPMAVPYYHAGCYDCAGAVAAGAVVGMAAGAAVANANHAVYPMGVSYARLPEGAVMVNRYGVDYYHYGDSWFRPFYGANGVYYSVVGAP